MARLPLYEQQTSAGQVRASGQAFGAGVAQAQQQQADLVQDIGVQMKRRQDVIERVQLTTDFDKFAQDALTTLNDTEDISKTETLDKYSQALRQKASEVLGAHRGLGASRAELQAQIENQVGQYMKSATAAQIKAQQSFIGNFVDQKANELAIKATLAPQAIGELFTEFDSNLTQLGDTMSPTMSEQYKMAGRSRMATGAIQNLLTSNRFGEAEQLMKNPEVAKYLDPDTARRFNIDIIVDKRKAELEVERQTRNVQKWTALTGRQLSPEEQLKVMNLPDKKDMTVADQIVEYELITGKPAPQSVIDSFYKIDGANGGGSLFGNSLQGRAISFVTENAVAYANGLLPADQARQFEAAMAEAYKPVMRQNPLNGQMEEVRPTIPRFVQQAVEQGGRVYGGVLTAPRAQGAAPMPGQQIMVNLPDGRSLGPATVDANGNWTVTDTSAPASGTPATGGAGVNVSMGGRSQGSGAAGGNQPAQAGQPTIWELADDIAGPVPAVTEFAGRIPGLGGAIGGGGDVATNRQYVRTQISQMVDALSINPRNPVALVEMIRKEIDVDPKVMDDPSAYRKRIEGVSRALTERLVEETNAANDPSLPVKTRQDAATVADTIRNFQQKLMPPMVKTRAELEALGLPPGAKFIDATSGKLKQVPGAQ